MTQYIAIITGGKREFAVGPFKTRYKAETAVILSARGTGKVITLRKP